MHVIKKVVRAKNCQGNWKRSSDYVIRHSWQEKKCLCVAPGKKKDEDNNEKKNQSNKCVYPYMEMCVKC